MRRVLRRIGDGLGFALVMLVGAGLLATFVALMIELVGLWPFIGWASLLIAVLLPLAYYVGGKV